jgi:hypothetical protein
VALAQSASGHKSWLSALFGQCGFRSRAEIEKERLALRTLRGDFRHLPSLHEMRPEPDELSRFEGEGGPANDADEGKLEPREAVRQVVRATAG